MLGHVRSWSRGCQAPMRAGSARPESRRTPDGVKAPLLIAPLHRRVPGLLCLCVSLIKRVFFNKASPRGTHALCLLLKNNEGSAGIGGGLPRGSQSSCRWSRGKSGVRGDYYYAQRPPILTNSSPNLFPAFQLP